MRPNYWEVRVECYAGYRGEEEPRRFAWRDREIQVSAILDRWLDPTHRYFKVEGDDGGVYMLRHDVDAGIWQLKAFLTRL
jgi:hypothetical protein